MYEEQTTKDTIYMSTFQKISKDLKNRLDKKRYTHTLSVADTAACMAMRFDEDPYRAYLAGLLHDNAKCIEDKKKLALCGKYKLEINTAEQKNPDLLHAKLGSFLAKERYQVEDPEILSSILYHTTGKPAMTTLEQIIYIADYIEINRKKLPGMEVTRKLAFTDLDACMLHILESTLAFLEKKGAAIDQITMETYTYYKERVQHNNEAQKGDTHDE
mgnify:FL=1